MTIHASPTSQRGVDDIGATVQITGVAALPLAPKNPLPYRQRLRALRVFHIGQETVRDAGGPVTRVSFGPKWLFPPVVVATSPKAARDVLGRKDAFVDKHIVHREMRQLLGENLLDLIYERWLPVGARCSRSSPNSASGLSAATCRRPRKWSPTDGATEPKSTLTPSVAD